VPPADPPRQHPAPEPVPEPARLDRSALHDLHRPEPGSSAGAVPDGGVRTTRQQGRSHKGSTTPDRPRTVEPFEDFMRREQKLVVGLLYKLTGDWYAAEDLAQIAFAAAERDWARIGCFDKPGAWVRKVAIRRQRRWQQRGELETWVLAQRFLGGRDEHVEPAEHAELWDMVWRLPRGQLEVTVLRYQSDLGSPKSPRFLGSARARQNRACTTPARPWPSGSGTTSRRNAMTIDDRLRRAADALNQAVARRLEAGQPTAFAATLSAARRGDEDAFAALWRQLQPALLRYLRVLVPEAAEDLAGETWLEVVRGLDRFDGDELRFRAWIFTIARHRTIDWWRRTTWLAAEPAAALLHVDPAAAGPPLPQADLVAARRGDPQAIARFSQAYAPGIHRFFVAALGDRHTAEDLTGTVLADATTALPNFRGPVEALGGWLVGIARHELDDHRRRQARAGTEHLDDVLDEAAMAQGAPDPQDLAVERLERSRVMAALDQLPPAQREVLLLRITTGLTTAEVAATLGKTTSAVTALQHRGLARLARVLDPRFAHETASKPRI
jgi:RNA polymerase sigma factor (sigma-70 family)